MVSLRPSSSPGWRWRSAFRRTVWPCVWGPRAAWWGMSRGRWSVSQSSAPAPWPGTNTPSWGSVSARGTFSTSSPPLRTTRVWMTWGILSDIRVWTVCGHLRVRSQSDSLSLTRSWTSTGAANWHIRYQSMNLISLYSPHLWSPNSCNWLHKCKNSPP